MGSGQQSRLLGKAKGEIHFWSSPCVFWPKVRSSPCVFWLFLDLDEFIENRSWGKNAMRCQQLWTVFAGNIQSRVISPRNEGNNSPNSPSPLSSTSNPLCKINPTLKIRQITVLRTESYCAQSYFRYLSEEDRWRRVDIKM